MFDKVSQAAEKLATNVSRRDFLGRLGQGALAIAGTMGAILAFPERVQAGQYSGHCRVIEAEGGYAYNGQCLDCRGHVGTSSVCVGGVIRPGECLGLLIGDKPCTF
jgi:hypothetical protein